MTSESDVAEFLRAVHGERDARRESARSLADTRGECGDAVTRQGSEREEMLEAIIGYGTRKAAGAAKTAREEEILRAILGGGALAATEAISR